ncbi:MAG: hypothetical protein ACLQQ4_00610 [Bacteroidia bacterium]
MKNNFLFAGIFSVLILTGISACKEKEESILPEEEVIKDSAKAATVTNLTLIMNNIPSPAEMSKELAKEGIPVNKGILTSPDKAGSCSGLFQQAAGMGILGADMGYVASYNQLSDAATYLREVGKLASALGIPSAYDQKLMDQFRNAVTNKDSVNVVIQTAFDRAQKELYSNKRASASTLIFAGGWVEGLYIATNLVNDEKNDKNAGIYTKIWSHVYAFSYLKKGLTDYQSNADCSKMLNMLKPLFDEASKLEDAQLSLNDIHNLKQLVADIRGKLI